MIIDERMPPVCGPVLAAIGRDRHGGGMVEYRRNRLAFSNGMYRFYSASAWLAMQSAVLARAILSVCLSVTLPIFRSRLKTHLFRRSFP